MRVTSYVRLSVSLLFALFALGAALLALGGPPVLAEPLAPATARNYPGAAPCDTTLQACVSASGNGDVISITAGTYITNPIVITRAIVLQGAGASSTKLGALGAQRVISVSANIAAGVTISNLRVFNGSLTTGTEGGAGIFAGVGTPLTVLNAEVMSNTLAVALPESGAGILANSPITLVNVIFVNNQALDGAGGGLRAVSTANIRGGRFERNVAFNPGGAMRANGLLTLNNVQVLSNSVTGSGQDGGGISALGGLFMQGGLVQNNVAADSGGGIVANAATITASNIISNAANRGGGIFVTGGLNITNTTFDKNKAVAGDGGAIYASGNVTITLEGTDNNLSNTTIANSSAITNGGGIFAAGNVLLVGAVTFNADKALNGEGGAIYTNDLIDSSGNSVLLKVTFTGNTALGKGGAVRALGKVNLLNLPTFSNNSAGGGTTADGGAIYADGSVFLSRGTSSGNTAKNGGAVFALGNVFFNVHDTLNNTAVQNGGCAYSQQRITYNSADARGCVAAQFGGGAYSPLTVTLQGNGVGLFNQNRAGKSGGAAFANVVEVKQAQLVSNTSPVGGGVAATRTLDIRDSTFSANTAANLGGAANVSGTLFVSNTLFAANVVTSTNGLGGALFTPGSAVVTASTFISNGTVFATGQRGGAIAANVLTTTQSSFVGNQSAFGGAISATTALVAGGVFTANGNTNHGGSSLQGGGVLATNLTVQDSRFISNAVNSCGSGCDGGAVYADNGRIVNSYFEGNVAGDEGAAVYISRTATISTSQFIHNTDDLNKSTAVFVFNSGFNSLVVDSLFDGNRADKVSGEGGALEAVKGDLTVSGSTFNNNRATGGGAISMQGSQCCASLNVLTSTFFNNLAVCCGGGGAIHAGFEVKIQNSTFISNFADCCDGGGAVFGDNFVGVQTSNFFSNSVESRQNGGAINAQGGLGVDGSTFENNRQLIDPGTIANLNFGRGGAIFVGQNSQNSLTNSTFRRNRSNHGGALACDGHCDVETSLFESNVADEPDTTSTFTNIGTGGAIQTNSDLEVYRSRFLRNRAGVAGGAIFQNRALLTAVPDEVIENSLFAENLARNDTLGSKGNAIAITGTVNAGKIFYNTIVSDSLTSGQAVVIMSGTVSVIDNIITNHAVGLERTSGTVFENFNLFFGDTTPVSGTLVAGSGANDLTGSDPLFVSPASDDYHLRLGSPAIDRGTDVLVNVDFDGDTRPIGAGFDIGFDERSAITRYVYLPLIMR